MTKQDVIKRLCALMTRTADSLDPMFAHDCFCGQNPTIAAWGGFQFNREIIQFVEQAVKEKLEKLEELAANDAKNF